jgi:hypothetical protein
MLMFAEEFLPTYDVSDAVAVVVDAGTDRTWDALMEVDLIDVGRRKPLVGLLSAVRMVPELVRGVARGQLPQRPPKQLRIRDTATPAAGDGGWVLLGERPGQTLALGLVGKFWRPVIAYAQVDRDDFRDFAEPGYAKTVYELSVRELPDGRSLLTGLMRTATTDEDARRMFRRYWTLGVGSGAHVLVNGVLERALEIAEHKAPSVDRPHADADRAVVA